MDFPISLADAGDHICCVVMITDSSFSLLTDKESAVWRRNITPMFNLNKLADIFSSRQSGEAPLRNSNPYLLLYHFRSDSKGVPFVC